MKKTNINKYKGEFYKKSYNSTNDNNSATKVGLAKNVIKLILKFLLTITTVLVITGLVVTVSLTIYILSLSSDEIDFDITATRLHLTSKVYINDENGVPQEYSSFHSIENRVWVDFDKIPLNMKNAVIAIEDKRFYEHNGIDLVRTSGAIFGLLTGRNNYGGSTITQQLIKNLTDDNEVSLTRKLREIFRAINFEKKYSKDEILEAYLNVVNFGNGCRGVQSAANTYFGKNINECDIAQCAAIAGITQNPSAFNPLIYPENNKKRRDTVLLEMYNQEMISYDEYKKAIEESNNMTFSKSSNNEVESSEKTEYRNWYIDTLYSDVHRDLVERLGISETAATDMILTQGLKIYCCMDKNAQEIAENVAKGTDVVPNDDELQLGYFMMDFNGRVLAVVGGKGEKEGDLLFNMATDAVRQPGSAIKPVGVYAPAIDLGLLNYSSILKDEPITEINGAPWPRNSYGSYNGNMSIQAAIQYSSNAAAVQALAKLTPQKSGEFLKNKLHFSTLEPEDSQGYSAYATGGMTRGVTVRELTASFQIFGNGGKYYKPYTYSKVEDRNGKVLLDNENVAPTQAISSQTATVMNKLLRTVITSGTGTHANISGWDIIGKTGTTDDIYDSWFVGESPYAVAGVWIGYETPRTVTYYTAAKNIWKAIMSQYLADKPNKDFSFDPKANLSVKSEENSEGENPTNEDSPDSQSNSDTPSSEIKESTIKNQADSSVPSDEVIFERKEVRSSRPSNKSSSSSAKSSHRSNSRKTN